MPDMRRKIRLRRDSFFSFSSLGSANEDPSLAERAKDNSLIFGRVMLDNDSRLTTVSLLGSLDESDAVMDRRWFLFFDFVLNPPGLLTGAVPTGLKWKAVLIVEGGFGSASGSLPFRSTVSSLLCRVNPGCMVPCVCELLSEVSSFRTIRAVTEIVFGVFSSVLFVGFVFVTEMCLLVGLRVTFLSSGVGSGEG